VVQFNVLSPLSEVEFPFVVDFKVMDKPVVIVDQVYVLIVCERSCVVVYNRLYVRQMVDIVGEDLQVWVLWEALVGSAILDVQSSRGEGKKLSLMSPARGDTTPSRLIPVSLDRMCEIERCLKAPSQQDRQEGCELTSLGQETQLGVLGTPRASLYTRETTGDHKQTASYG
jgi:hypothetical protein